VRDRFICGLANVKVKEKLLAISGITLEQAIDKSRVAGLLKEQNRVMEQSDDDRVAAVQKSRSHDQRR
jgi:glutaredoxin 2